MRIVLAAFLACVTGCSWVFMDHVTDDYRAENEPHCSTSNGWWILDGVNIVGNLGYAVAVNNSPESTDDQKTAAWASAVVGVVIHGLSAISGGGWVGTCRDARAVHEAYERQAYAEQEERRGREIVEERERREAMAREPREPAGPPTFYCASSPIDSTVGVCTGLRGSCEKARNGLAAAGSDLGPCAAAPAAVCSVVVREGKATRRCAPTVGSCNRRRAELLAAEPAVTAGECADVLPGE